MRVCARARVLRPPDDVQYCGFYLTPDMLKLVRAFPGSPSSAFHILCLPTETLLVSPSILFFPCSTFSRIQPALPIR